MEVLSTQSFKNKVFDFEKNKEWQYSGDLPAIIDFYADWCGPCRMLSPVLEEISKEYAGKIHVYKVNTEATPELAAMFRIRGIPSLLFVPKGEKPSMSSGFLPKEALKEAIRDVLKVAEPLKVASR